MEQIIKEYGGFLLDGMVMVLLIAVLFAGISDTEGNTGVAAMIGARLETESTDYHAYTDFRETYRTESSKENPKITYSGINLKTGVNKLSEQITASDYAGRLIAVKVTSIISPAGLELIGSYDPETAEIDLPQPGIYTIAVSARDDTNRHSEYEIRIPVNK